MILSNTIVNTPSHLLSPMMSLISFLFGFHHVQNLQVVVHAAAAIELLHLDVLLNVYLRENLVAVSRDDELIIRLLDVLPRYIFSGCLE